jgi:O-antigen/teichoic acid export membrane protein
MGSDNAIGTSESSMSPRGLPIWRNFSWNFFGNIIYALAQWGMLVALSKVSSVYAVGQYTLALALTAPVIQFTNMQLRGVQATDVRNEFSFGTYLGLRIICTLLGLMVIVVLGLWGRYGWETFSVISAMGFAKSFEAISDIIYGLFQKHETMNFVGRSLILKSVLSFGTIGGGLLLTGSLAFATWLQAGAWLALLVLYDMRNAKRFGPFHIVINRSRIMSLLGKGVPLGIVMMMISLNTNIPRYFISHYMGPRLLGYFGALSYVVIAGNTFVTALGQAASPRLSRYYASCDVQRYAKMTMFLCILGTVIAIVPVVLIRFWGSEILAIIYKGDYASYSWVFFLLMIAAGVGYVTSFAGYSLTAARYFNVQPVILLLTVLSCVLASLFLVRSHGLEGAAYALIISSCVQLVSTVSTIVWIVRKGYRKESVTMVLR